jgi:hypothetical protein
MSSILLKGTQILSTRVATRSKAWVQILPRHGCVPHLSVLCCLSLRLMTLLSSPLEFYQMYETTQGARSNSEFEQDTRYNELKLFEEDTNFTSYNAYIPNLLA